MRVIKQDLYSENRFAISHGQVDQLEDRYLGMVEAGGSNPPLSTSYSYLSKGLAHDDFFFNAPLPIDAHFDIDGDVRFNTSKRIRILRHK